MPLSQACLNEFIAILFKLFNLSKNYLKDHAVSQSTPISEIIKQRLHESNAGFFANDNISEFINEEEREQLKIEISSKLESLFHSMVIDIENDHNTNESSKRLAKMYVDEVFKGRYHPMPETKDFPNFRDLDEMYTLGPVTVRSACSHHFVPIIGHAWVGIMPSDKVIGISKFNRVIDWVMSRPHIQEEAAIMVADKLEELVKPKGIAVVIKAQHMCMTWRGVKETNTTMVNSVVRGAFRENKDLQKRIF